MENQFQQPVLCSENQDLASFMWNKRREMADSKKLSDRTDATIYKAYRNVCKTKTPIKTLKELSQIKGVGKWIIKLMQEFFETNDGTSEPEDLTQDGEKTKRTRRYVPQKNSAAYALLITLYRATVNGSQFMLKEELIDATEASGLSRVPIAPETGKGKPKQFGSSGREWYSGWSCMKGLVTKALVAKSCRPVKYMLTQEGLEAARECLSRSGLADCNESMPTTKTKSSQEDASASDLERPRTKLANKVSRTTLNKGTSALRSASRQRLQKVQFDSLLSDCRQAIGRGSIATSSICVVEDNDHADTFEEMRSQARFSCGDETRNPESSSSVGTLTRPCSVQACSSSKSFSYDSSTNALMMPPLNSWERFEDAYDVILILDDREQFTKNNKRHRSGKIIENISIEFNIQVEIRRLPIGDGIWIARHKHHEQEYVLDFIVERKEVDDLRMSIRDNRYKDQKLRLLRCGLRKLIYLVEGDPNFCEAAESIKTACFTTEILEGFDVQRTSGLGDTLRKYGYLTRAITHRYRNQACSNEDKHTEICPSFDEFTKRCDDLAKITVSDVFGMQLMQVPQVTEEIALAVLDLYPTVLSLACAYSTLEGGVVAQEEMLMKQSKNLISGSASRNIFQLVWGG